MFILLLINNVLKQILTETIVFKIKLLFYLFIYLFINNYNY